MWRRFRGCCCLDHENLSPWMMEAAVFSETSIHFDHATCHHDDYHLAKCYVWRMCYINTCLNWQSVLLPWREICKVIVGTACSVVPENSKDGFTSGSMSLRFNCVCNNLEGGHFRRGDVFGAGNCSRMKSFIWLMIGNIVEVLWSRSRICAFRNIYWDSSLAEVCKTWGSRDDGDVTLSWLVNRYQWTRGYTKQLEYCLSKGLC
jgi:hypothetical protein